MGETIGYDMEKTSNGANTLFLCFYVMALLIHNCFKLFATRINDSYKENILIF